MRKMFVFATNVMNNPEYFGKRIFIRGNRPLINKHL